MSYFRIRLMGGPFDGSRHRIRLDTEDPPPRLYVARCVFCGCHLYLQARAKAEVYRRDIEDDRAHVYVFTDERLSPNARTEERELVTAGGVPEKGWDVEDA